MISPKNPSSSAAGRAASGGDFAVKGPAAIVAPASSFPGGVPPEALVVVPLSAPDPELATALAKGAVALSVAEMWKLLGFNGPAVQVTDSAGRPLAIGLEDYISGLQKNWDEAPAKLDRGRFLVRELLKYGEFEKAEVVLKKLLQKGGNGEDQLALGIAELEQQKLDEAEASLAKAQAMLPKNPYPTLHLARAAAVWKDRAKERERLKQAIGIDPSSLEAWEYLFTLVRELEGEDKAAAAIEELAKSPAHQKNVAPYVAVSRVYSGDSTKQDQALVWAKKAMARNATDTLALLALSSCLGRARDFEEAIKLLEPHENKMAVDLRLASNYFLALLEARKIERTTRFLAALASSPKPEVKQFAAERSRFVAQYLGQQQAELAAAVRF